MASILPKKPRARAVVAPSISVLGHADIGDQPLFADIELRLQAEHWTCLLGGSGVGKSTILRLIAGLDVGASFHGEILADDGDPIPDRVAYMAQDDLLLPWATVAQNVTLGSRLRGDAPDGARASELIQEVGLKDHTDKKPSQLSGGQRQRAALARTLMEDKPIVLLDEPFSALDAKTRSEMQDLAARLLAGRTVLLVTHEPAEAVRLGHSIAVLTKQGLQATPVPRGSIPRAIDAPDVLASGADLLAHLRGQK